MVDPLYTAAQRTNQSGDRGWDFRPAADDHEPSRFGLAICIIAVLCIGLSLIGSVA